MKKIFAFLTASAMAWSSIPFFSASAARETFPIGDVDMDGVVTGHDAAILSRYLNHKEFILTDDQLALADVDGNGTIDQADADWIHQNQEYMLGDTDMNGEHNIDDVMIALGAYAKTTATGTELELTEVQLNLLDVTGDTEGKTLLDIAFENLCFYSKHCAGWYWELKQEYGFGTFEDAEGNLRYYWAIEEDPEEVEDVERLTDEFKKVQS